MRLPAFVFLLVEAYWALGCVGAPPKTPMDWLPYPAGPAPADTVVVFLPGRGDRGADFENRGFVSAVRRRKLPLDLVAADAHWGYYRTRTLQTRLHEDVLAPARARHKRLWLAGVSAGGFGALLYARAHPGAVEGIVLLAPFLGGSRLINEIERAGGLSAWQPGPVEAEDHERAAWAWLKNYAPGASGYPRLVLGYGGRDSFARANGLLAASLPPADVFTGDGAHDWETWQGLWSRVLDAGALSPPDPSARGTGSEAPGP